MGAPPLCELRGVRKAFGGVRALDGVDLEVRPGEIHALVGENGAGKSTLIRILSGLLRPDRGEVLFEGIPRALRGPRAASALGVAAAHQDPQLFEWRSVLENCFNGARLPGTFLISWPQAEAEARAALARLGAELPARLPAALLSASERQLLALAGAILRRPRLLILDEPTAALSAPQAERLFEVLREHRAGGGSALYVSHRLEEVLAISDRATVLRDGRVVLVRRSAGLTSGELVEAMVGRRLEAAFPRPPAPGQGPPLLEAECLSDPDGAFEGVSLEVRRGEVLGIYGLVGAGRSELGQALAGLRPLRGGLRARGRVAYLPEDRLREGNLPGLSLRENLSIASLSRLRWGPFIDSRRERRLAEDIRERLGIRAPGLEAEVGALSGGNQQKALLGRWLATEPEVLVLDEPTQGIDVGARAEIHGRLAELARAGRGLVLISSDLPEALGMSHRLLVLRQGRLSAAFLSAETSEEEVARAALPEEASGGGAGAVERRALRPRVRPVEREAALLAAVLGIVLLTGVRSPDFLSLQSLRDIASNGAPLALAALGQTILIASGAIDISIGAVLALCATAAALRVGGGGGAAGAVLLAGLLGAALGSLNAGICALGRIHPIITTLGMFGIYRGVFLLWLSWAGGNWIVLPDALLVLASSGPLGIPWTAWGVAAAAALGFLFLGWTRSGRALLHLGDNPRAAVAHGARPGLRRWLAFAILGALVGLAGVAYTARFGTVQNNTGTGFELQAIAAAVLGGAHVAGGRGTVPGALLGAALIAVIQDARAVWGIHERWQLVAAGGLLLGALLLETVVGRAPWSGAPGRRER